MTSNAPLMETKNFSTSNRDHNILEFTVGEISQAVKRTLEGSFGRVRVKGEVSQPNYHSSGHLYFKLKDEDAAMDGVSWRGTVEKLGLTLEEGMEVVCTGRISSYPRSSRYQIVIEAVELAGEGALLKLLEVRRKKLLQEGLFDPDKKLKLPYLPDVIGVITSPTGSVIRDILHRLADRFPRHVLLWPVSVQGENAANQISKAISGFNALDTKGAIPKPDLLIVARGGGSLEDLWAFNEENVVRATALSNIPLISAVGHETDTTLIDLAADLRAPTPTAAAELAVPVRLDLEVRLIESERRLVTGMGHCYEDHRIRLEGFARGLPKPDQILEEATQRLDNETDRLMLSMLNLTTKKFENVLGLGARLRHPKMLISVAEETFRHAFKQLDTIFKASFHGTENRFYGLDSEARLFNAITNVIKNFEEKLIAYANLLSSVSYKAVLRRGFALIRDYKGQPIVRAKDAIRGEKIEIEFSDGTAKAKINLDSAPPPGIKQKEEKKKNGMSKGTQGSLL